MSRRSPTPLILAVALMLALVLLVAHMALDLKPRRLRAPLSTLPATLGPWNAVGNDRKMDQATLQLLSPQDYLLRTYLGPHNMFAMVFVAYFGMQRQGQMIHSPRHCLPGAGWQIFKRSQVTVAGPRGPVRINHMIMVRDLERLSVLYWYQGRGRIEYSEYLDRLYLVWDGLRRHRSDGALVRITTPINDAAELKKILAGQVKLAEALMPALRRIFPSDGDVKP